MRNHPPIPSRLLRINFLGAAAAGRLIYSLITSSMAGFTGDNCRVISPIIRRVVSRPVTPEINRPAISASQLFCNFHPRFATPDFVAAIALLVQTLIAAFSFKLDESRPRSKSQAILRYRRVTMIVIVEF